MAAISPVVARLNQRESHRKEINEIQDNINDQLSIGNRTVKYSIETDRFALILEAIGEYRLAGWEVTSTSHREGGLNIYTISFKEQIYGIS